jgi:hypothetical protein
MKSSASAEWLVDRSCIAALALGVLGACSASGSDRQGASGGPDQHTADSNAGGSESGNLAAATSGTAGGPLSSSHTGTDGASAGSGGGFSTFGTDSSTTARDYPDIEFVYDPEKDLPPVVCAEETLSAEPLPLDMYIVLDRTGSMIEEMPAGEDCQLGVQNPPTFNTKWCKATQALSQYFMGGTAAGHRAALQFMIPAESTSIECGAVPENLHARANVDLTELPTTVDGPLLAALAAAEPDTPSTAIESALNGIVMYTADNATAGRQMIGVLVTDGDPTFCSQTIATLASIPQRHFEGTGIPTFIIGMTGAEPGTLQALAEHGGSPEHSEFCDPSDSGATCHYWSVGDGDPEAFVAALEAIQAAVTGCEFAVPATNAGLVDLDTVRVELSADQATMPVELTRVESEDDCTEGAYLTAEINGVPTIRLCAAACAAVSGTARISVTVECEGR